MPGDNCAFNQCGTSRRTKGVGLFKLPTAKDEESTNWRRDFYLTLCGKCLWLSVLVTIFHDLSVDNNL